MKRLVCVDGTNQRTSVKGYVCAHALCIFLHKHIYTVKCSGTFIIIKMVLKFF